LLPKRAEQAMPRPGNNLPWSSVAIHRTEEKLTAFFLDSADNANIDFYPSSLSKTMSNIIIIEDDMPTSNQLTEWVRGAQANIQTRQCFTRDEAEAALAEAQYDLVVLDIELGRERHAGVAIINLINTHYPGTPVLVVSAMPATIYRSIMKALDAWDYLQKTTFEEADFIETLLDILRVSRNRKPPAKSAPVTQELVLDPLWQRTPSWRGERINLPLTAQRILATLYQRRNQIVSYDELYAVVKSGRTRDNVRKHVSTIRDAFREIDPHFDKIENIPLLGFRWVD
jgi:two-component system, OmpR family, response regulator ChvI